MLSGDYMLKKIKENKELDIVKVNNTINTLDKILKIAYILIVLAAVFLVIKLLEALNFKYILIVVLKTLAPLFIGLFLAWLFAPIVKKMSKKGIKRSIGTTIVYIIFIGLLALLICSIVPVLTNQVNEFVTSLPSIFDSIKNWLADGFGKIGHIDGLDVKGFENNIVSKIEEYGGKLATELPGITVNVVKILASGLGTFIVGLIIGFYLLIGFDNAGDLLITLCPKKIQDDARELSNEINNSLRRFINGALIDSFFVFVITSIAFALIGLKAPLLFGLFCGITNVIPYAGPYIGGIPAVIVGFSQNPIIGILTLVSIVVIQFLEGNLLQPFIMSKTTKLHPVTIIVGLLIFGHFFGIVGMVISTPLIAVMKSVVMFFMEKLDIDLFENV